MANEATKEKLLSDGAPHLLIIDDDRRIRDLIRRYLIEQGFRVTLAANSDDARANLKGLEFDLLIVDVMMPGENGLSLTKSLKETMDVPILMLTALTETDNRIEGLEAGADDYLAKPFDPRELVLRINNILKRTAKPDTPVVDLVAFGPYQFSVIKRELKREGQSVRLTEREREIMVVFANRMGETVARHELLLNNDETSERKVDVQINRLRRKIEADPGAPKWLQTVRGVGYRLLPN